MNPFRSRIKCKHCLKNYRLKVEKGTRKFICGGYNNGTGCTRRLVVMEDFIRGLINRRYERELSDEEISNVLDYIEIEDELIMEIHFTDGSIPILLHGTFIQF